jgi:LPXTG-motif cell wall-anchored protein
MDYKGITGGMGGGLIIGGAAATLPATGGNSRLILALGGALLFAVIFSIRYKWRGNKKVNQK